MGMTQLLADAQAGREAKAMAVQNQVSDAELRAAIAEEKASQIAGLARSVLDPHYVMAQNVYTPQASVNPNTGNVQDREIPEYGIPSLYKQPAAPIQNQGLGWSVAIGNGYNQ